MTSDNVTEAELVEPSQAVPTKSVDARVGEADAAAMACIVSAVMFGHVELAAQFPLHGRAARGPADTG